MTKAPEAAGEAGFEAGSARAERLAQTGAFLRFFRARFNQAHVSSGAGALSFSSTLAVVPALALVLASLAAFPAFDPLRDRLQALIINNLVPDTGMEINQALEGFIGAAGKLTAVGIVGLASTAIVLLLTVEGQLNLIFGITRPRPLVYRLLVFWAVMTVGPLLLAVGFSLFGVFSQMPFVAKVNSTPGVRFLLGNIMPSIITWAVLVFLYVIVPHHRVRRSDAMIGALVAAVFLAILRDTFAFYVTSMTSYKAIYGALAAVPVFLVWVYAIWLIVLTGAVVAAALPGWRLKQAEAGPWPAGRIVLALDVLARLTARRRDGYGCTTTVLAQALGLSESVIVIVLENLRDGRFVVLAEGNQWVLSRDLERTPLSDLMHHFGVGVAIDGLALPKTSPYARRLDFHLQRAQESERRLLSISLARLLAGEEPHAPAAEAAQAHPS